VTTKQAAALQALSVKGWFIKIRTYHNGSQPQWQCWLSWRGGPEPHKEESHLADSLGDAAVWFTETAKDWYYE